MKLLIIYTPILFIFSCSLSAPGPKSDLEGFARESIGHHGALIGYKAADDTWLAKGTVISDVRNGSWVTYHPGKDAVKTITTYVHGKKNGMEIEFNDRGGITAIIEYKNDQLHGMSAKYQFGRATEETHYKDGVMHGPYAIYTSQGQVQRKGSFKEGKQNGLLQYYDLDGNVTLEYVYKDGEKISGGIVEKPAETEKK